MPDPRVRDVVQYAVGGTWSTPEFQREFEWDPEQVTMLCESLSQRLPVGLLTVWNTTGYNEPQQGPKTGHIPQWIVDGQQRVISLCILLGKKPVWLESWDGIFARYRVWMNIDHNGECTLGPRSKKSIASIPVDEILNLPAGRAQRRITDVCKENSIDNTDKAYDLGAALVQIPDKIIPVAEIGEDQPVEMVAEVFRRLNRQGTNLRQAQIMLAYVSQYNPGWVRSRFYPFLQDLQTHQDWELDPAHALQVATIVIEGRARVGEVSKDFWRLKIVQHWPRVKDAIDETLLNLFERGIVSQDMIPSSYSLIALFALHAKFGNLPGYDFEKAFKWFIKANLSGRYGGRPLEMLSKDSKEIYESQTLDEALGNLHVDLDDDAIASLFDQKFRDNSSIAMLIHVLLWSRNAKDWLEKLSIPTITKSPNKLEPHWHHIVPKAIGKKLGFVRYEAAANVTLICAKTNVAKLKAIPPWEYVPQFGIEADALKQHYVPDEFANGFASGHIMDQATFQRFLSGRETLIMAEATRLLGE